MDQSKIIGEKIEGIAPAVRGVYRSWIRVYFFTILLDGVGVH